MKVKDEVTMKMGEGKECYLNLAFEETGSTLYVLALPESLI